MTERTLTNTSAAGAKAANPSVVFVGNRDLWHLLSEASSEAQGWIKSSKAMEIPGVGCVVRVTTREEDAMGAVSVAEALTFVPGVEIAEDENGGCKLVPFTYKSRRD